MAGGSGIGGAADLGQLIVSLGVDVRGLQVAITEMQKFGVQAQTAGKQAVSSFEKSGRAMQYFGWYASMYLTAPITLFGTAAFNAAKDFEFSMTKIIGLVGESRQQVAQWSDEILKLGPALGSSPKKLAEGMYFITSSGFTGAKAMSILEQSSKAAAAGLGDVNKIADFTTSAMNAYADENITAANVMDILTAAVREGKLEATGFTNEIGQVIPVAAAMGVGLDEVAAAMASMSLTGTNASEATVYLRGILNAMLDPAKEAEDALRMMGTSGEEMRKMISEQGLLPALKKLSDLTNKYGEDLVSKVIPNVRAMTGFLSLTGQNYEHNLQIFKEVYASTGDMDKAFKAVAGTIEFRWNKALSTLQSALIMIGMAIKDTVLPVITLFSNAVMGLANWISQLNPVAQKIVTVLAGFVALLGPLSAGLGFIIRYIIPALKVGFSSLIALLSNPIFATIVIVAGAIAVAMSLQADKTREAADAQKQLNDELQKTQEFQAATGNIGAQMAVLATMNKRQLEATKQRIESQITQEEDYTTTLLAELNKRLKADVELQKLQKQYSKATTEQGRIAAAALIQNRKEQIAQDLELQNQGNQKSLSTLRTYLAEVEKAIKNKSTETKVANPAIKEIMDAMNKEKASIEGMIPIMAKAGKEWDANSKLESLYTKTIQDLLPYLPAASKEVQTLTNWLANLGSSTKKTTNIMDDLTGELDYIKAMGELGLMSKSQMDEESLNAYATALQKMAKEGKISGAVIDELKKNMASYSNRVLGITPIMDNLNKQLQTSEFMGTALGEGYDVVGAKVSILSGAVQSLYENIQNSNVGIFEKILLLAKLKKALGEATEEEKKQQMQMNNTSIAIGGITDMIFSMGQAIGEGNNAVNALASSLLSMAQQVIASMMQQYLATMLSTIATGTQKEVASKGFAGLIPAAIGVAAMIGMMNKAKSQATSIAHMAEGGIIPPGYPNDSFPAMLSSNEAVIPLGDLKHGVQRIQIEGKMKGYDIYWQRKKYDKHLSNVS